MNPRTTTIYDSSNRDRLSLYAWRVMFRELYDSRELIVRLVLRNFSAQFRQSFLGYAWIIFPPVATTLIFAVLRQAQIVNIPMEGRDIPYVLFALIGVTTWGMFTQFVMSATASISKAGSLVSKIYFPREVLVVSEVGGALINSLIQFAVVAVTCVLLRYVPAWQVVFVPLALLPMLFLAMGLGLFFAPINTMMNDMGRILQFLFQFGMLMAPTVYPTPRLAVNPETGEWPSLAMQFIFWIHSLNPVSHTLYAVRDLVETGQFVFTTGWLVSTLLGLLVFAIGWRSFHVCEPLLAERL
jgi:lipopolysaccharide transport system permease protein